MLENNKKVKISIIIPVYKAEHYIERCVRSLMEQTMNENIEFIFINDCSPDNTIDVLKTVLNDYPKRRHQVKIINNDINIGPHDSRRRGINEAKGDYIGFCDADDWVESKMYEAMNSVISNNQDIVVCNYFEEEVTGSSLFEFKSSESPHESLANMHDCHSFSWAMWNQLVRKEIILDEIDQIYPTKMREDTFLMMRCYYKAKSIAFIPEAFYHYNLMVTESLIHTRKCTTKGWKEQMENIDRISNLLYETKEGYQKFHFAINNFKFMLKKEYSEVFPTIKEYYYTYRECHKDAIKEVYHQSQSIIISVKMWIVYCTSFWIFKYYNELSEKSISKKHDRTIKIDRF